MAKKVSKNDRASRGSQKTMQLGINGVAVIPAKFISKNYGSYIAAADAKSKQLVIAPNGSPYPYSSARPLGTA